MKSSKKALFSSVIALILCFSMLIGTTFAWFTDSVSSGVNQIVAGNLDVELYHTNKNVTSERVTSTTGTLFNDVTLWEPGAYAYETFTVKNEGTLALKYKMAINVAGYTSYNGHNLTEVLKVKVVDTAPTSRPTYTDGVALNNWTYGAGAVDNNLYPVGSTLGDSEKSFTVVVYWEPTDNDNDFNMNNGRPSPLSVDLGVELVATQLVAESDSFGTDYDENAGNTLTPVVKVDNAMASAIVSGDGSATMSAQAVPATQSTVKQTKVDFAAGALEAGTAELSVNTTNTLFNVTAAGNAQVASIDLTLTVNGTPVTTFNGQSATVTTYISTGLDNVAVTYTDPITNAVENITVTRYDPATGELIFTTNHFSRYDVCAKAVAYDLDADKGYDTYQTAAAAAANNTSASITLSPDANLTEASNAAANAGAGFELPKDTVIDETSGKWDAKIGAKYYATLANAINAANSGETIMLLQNVTENDPEGACIVYDLTGKTLDLNGKTYSHHNFAHVFEGTGGTIKNGEMVCLNNSSYALFVGDEGETERFTVDSVTMKGGINIYNASNVVLKNLNVTGTNFYAVWLDEGAEATIESGTYTAGNVAAVNVFNQSVLTIAGGTINANDKPLMGESGGKLVVTGGTFSSDPSAYVADGCEVKSAENQYVVSKITYWSNFAAESYATPVDAENKVVTIASAAELALFAKQVNSGTKYQGYQIVIKSNIDLSANKWIPLMNEWAYSDSLSGSTIDGEGHTIYGMRTYHDTAAGFISYNASTLTIKNLTFDGAIVKTKANQNQSYAGVLMGKTYSSVSFENVTVNNADVFNNWQCGGFVGFAEGYGPVFKNCSTLNSHIGGYNATAGSFFGLGIVDVSLENCTAMNVQLYTDSLTWNSTAKKVGNFYVGHLYSKTLTTTNCIEENVTVVSQ